MPAPPSIDFASMSEVELAASWTVVGLDVPQPLVEETLKRGSRMVPYLGPLIAGEDAWDTWTDEADPAGWAPIHALMLLTAIGGPEVVPYAAAFLREGFGEDWLTEQGHELVRALGPSAVEPVAEVIEDLEADVWGRWEAVDGLRLLCLEQTACREAVAARLRGVAERLLALPRKRFSDDDAMVLSGLGHALAELHDEASRPLIREAFRKGRWDEDYSSQEDVEKDFGIPFEESLRRNRSDPLKHFSPEELARLKEVEEEWKRDRTRERVLRPDLKDDDILDPLGSPLHSGPGDVPSAARVGRNDPCPCGSGKKFKKCCGA